MESVEQKNEINEMNAIDADDEKFDEVEENKDGDIIRQRIAFPQELEDQKPTHRLKRTDNHFISKDKKHDGCLWPASAKQMIENTLLRKPNLKAAIIATDTSKKEFKSVSAFEKLKKIGKRKKVPILYTTFGPKHGKGKYDLSGKIWRNEYKKGCVYALEIAAMKVEKVAEYFNMHFTKPKSKLAKMDERKTYVTEPVIHTLSKFKSLPGTTKSFSFFLDPNKSGISYRRGFCISCDSCKDLDFLKCSDKSKGTWNYSEFIRK